jgi:hypothetical protein
MKEYTKQNGCIGLNTNRNDTETYKDKTMSVKSMHVALRAEEGCYEGQPGGSPLIDPAGDLHLHGKQVCLEASGDNSRIPSDSCHAYNLTSSYWKSYFDRDLFTSYSCNVFHFTYTYTVASDLLFRDIKGLHFLKHLPVYII